MEKFRQYLYFFLFFSVLSSKNIIIYNEEIVVALTFLGFIFFIIYLYGGEIKGFFDEKESIIWTELLFLAFTKKKLILSINKQYKNLSNSIFLLQPLSQFTKNNLLIAPLQGKETISLYSYLEMTQKLKIVSFFKKTYIKEWKPFYLVHKGQKVEEFIASSFYDSIFIQNQL